MFVAFAFALGCSREPSPAVVEGRAEVTLAETAVQRARSPVQEAEARLAAPRAELARANERNDAAQQRCNAAQAEHAALERSLPPGVGTCAYVPHNFTREQVAACSRFNAAVRHKTQVCNEGVRTRAERDRAARAVGSVEQELRRAQAELARAEAALTRARERLAALEAADR